MKKLFTLLVCILFVSAIKAQSISIPDSTKKIIKAEASCGQCQFGIKAAGCNLAVRIDGKAYFVDGTSLDDHGDAHAADGFCEAIRKAEVQGKVVDNRFKATYFKVLPLKKEEAAKMQ
jgi:Family of unknown function (DUF6370)